MHVLMTIHEHGTIGDVSTGVVRRVLLRCWGPTVVVDACVVPHGMPGTACPSTKSVLHTITPWHSANARQVPLAGVADVVDAVDDTTTAWTVLVDCMTVLVGVHGCGMHCVKAHPTHLLNGVLRYPGV
eukprot:m.1016582 g.1016582  ORF g.1016582 m.1016582 type:complete len:128 (+) comp24080_c0_seq3:99-482(+)